MNKIVSLFVRYLILIALGMGNLFLFYWAFTPLTTNLVLFLLSLLDQTILLSKDTFIFNSAAISLVPACIAGAAYYLLTILVLSTPNIKLKTRLGILAFSFIVFLVLNSIRIFILAAILGSSWFGFFHAFFWYFVSTVLVLGIWFLDVKIFKIKSIPVVDDLRALYPRRKKQ